MREEGNMFLINYRDSCDNVYRIETSFITYARNHNRVIFIGNKKEAIKLWNRNFKARDLESERKKVTRLNKLLNTYDKGIEINVDEDFLKIYEIIDDDGRTIKRGSIEAIVNYVKAFNREDYKKEQEENIKAFARDFM